MNALGRALAWCLAAGLMLWGCGSGRPSGMFAGLLFGGLVVVALLRSKDGDKRAGTALESKDQEELAQRLFAAPLAAISPKSALLKPGEQAYAAAMGTLYEVGTTGFKAGTRGVSVRVAKGVTLRSGGVRGGAVKGPVAVAEGELVIPNRRVIFAGNRKSFVIPLDDLLNATNYSDGFGFSDGRTTYTVITPDDTERIAFAVALHRVTHPAGTTPV